MNDRPPVTNAEIVQALRKNWRAEKESAQLYRELAGSEKDTKRKAVLLRLAGGGDRGRRGGAHREGGGEAGGGGAGGGAGEGGGGGGGEGGRVEERSETTR